MTEEHEAVAYEQIQPRLRTGDLILFHGMSARSKLVLNITRSDTSHAGMVYRPEPDLPPLLWHSDPQPVTLDVHRHRVQPGAQLNDLALALAKLGGPETGDTLYVRHLVVDRSSQFERSAQAAVRSMDGTPFPSIIRIIEEWVLGHLHIETSRQKMYCAEVLAATYQRMGLLPRRPPANGYTPKHFSDDRPDLPLLKGARLGPMIRVVPPPTLATAERLR